VNGDDDDCGFRYPRVEHIHPSRAVSGQYDPALDYQQFPLFAVDHDSYVNRSKLDFRCCLGNFTSDDLTDSFNSFISLGRVCRPREGPEVTESK
jgi:hypothetical protein